LAGIIKAGHISAGFTAVYDAFGDLAPFGRVRFLAAASDTTLGRGDGVSQNRFDIAKLPP
jgi:hypothetical protein